MNRLGKILLLATVLSAPVFKCSAQPSPSPAEDSTLSFPCSLHDAQFVAATMPSGHSVVDAITWAAQGVTDSATVINVIITQRDLVDVALVCRQLPEGISAEVNARLLSIALPLAYTRPWLLGQLLAVNTRNKQETKSVTTRGATLMQRKLAAATRQ